MIANMKTVQFKHWNCNMVFAKYSNGRTAIKLMDPETGEPIAVATVNIPECPLTGNEIIIKDYSENEGMLSALVNAGVIEDTGKTFPSGFITANICKLIIKP